MATDPSVLLQVPPVVVSDNEVVLPAHTVAVPVIDDGTEGKVFTVTTNVAAALPQLFEIV